MQKIGLRVPVSRVCHSLTDVLDFFNFLGKKIIVKPLNLTGGRGISTISSKDDALLSIQELGKHGSSEMFIAEEFLTGTNHGFTTLIENCKVKFYFSDTEGFKQGKFRVGRTISESNFTRNEEDQLVREIELFASSLELVDGILHCQTIKSDGEIFILEMCRRTPGDLYPWFCEMSTGVDISRGIVEAAIGTKISAQKQPNVNKVCRIIVTPDSPGTFKSVQSSKLPEGIRQSRFTTRNAGDNIISPHEWTAEVIFLIGKKPLVEELFMDYHPKVLVGK
jgi:biotin carboxylase